MKEFNILDGQWLHVVGGVDELDLIGHEEGGISDTGPEALFDGHAEFHVALEEVDLDIGNINSEDLWDNDTCLQEVVGGCDTGVNLGLELFKESVSGHTEGGLERGGKDGSKGRLGDRSEDGS